ncbi:MAG TPA: M60 family peptidase N-terminal accessory domain-containing protein, partial [Roseimicrobium sp.]|nr:M60 family peptidase N-terminal accessory domain-containing protein [Roseimicrobium sp.]
MKRILCILTTIVSILIQGTSSAQSPTASSDTTTLLGGVRDLALVGSPGQLCVYGTNAFPVIAGDVGKSGDAVVVAAARWNRGRVVAYSHNGYIDASKDADAQRLMLNAVRWTGQIPAPKVAVRKKAGLVKQLQGQQIPVEALDGATWIDRLKDFKVLCCDSEEIKGDDVQKAVREFVQNGGGLVTGSTGWGWLQVNPGKTLTEDHWGNRLLSGIGIVWADGTAGKTGPKGFVTNRKLSPYLHAGTALLLAHQMPTPPPSKDDLAQANWTVTQAIRSLPENDTLLRPRLAALLSLNSQPAPTGVKPLKSTDFSARLALTLQLTANRSAAPESIRAHPAASHFPGEVPATAARLKGERRQITSQQHGWKSLGLYAAPGELIRVTVPPAMASQKLRVRIGCHSD